MDGPRVIRCLFKDFHARYPKDDLLVLGKSLLLEKSHSLFNSSNCYKIISWITCNLPPCASYMSVLTCLAKTIWNKSTPSLAQRCFGHMLATMPSLPLPLSLLSRSLCLILPCASLRRDPLNLPCLPSYSPKEKSFLIGWHLSQKTGLTGEVGPPANFLRMHPAEMGVLGCRAWAWSLRLDLVSMCNHAPPRPRPASSLGLGTPGQRRRETLTWICPGPM